MNRVLWFPILGLVGVLATASAAWGQSTAYIGYVYPAGGQQGATFQVKLGGQRIDGVEGAIVTGEGVSAKLVEYHRKLSPQDVTLMREQVRELRKEVAAKAKAKGKAKPSARDAAKTKKAQELIARIDKRISEWVNRPACTSLSSIAVIEVTAAPDAPPGAREIRLVTPRGVTNPLVFHVGQLPEVTRKAMITSTFQVLGKEALALRKRPPEEEEEQITVPCTMNGQIASGEVNRYRFQASQGQRLVISVQARQLIPYIADAVPGWFQPVLSLHDAEGTEVAYNDDFRFEPDPTMSYEVAKDGEYVLTITDAIYRGREDFVYRITIGELPFVTSIFPLGGRVGEPVSIAMDGWNLDKASLTPPPKDAQAGVHQITATKEEMVSNSLPFALDTLPECFDAESNNDPSQAQKVQLPIIVNGRIDQSDDWDVFRVDGKSGDTIVAEVHARRLDSPVDSMLKLTDATGKVLAFNDDRADAGSGWNTHHADSYLMLDLPADGTYYVHLGDTARNGGKEYAYRLRLSAPQPDFALRVVPSGGGLRSKGSAAVSIYAIRKDGFSGDIKLGLKDAPDGFTASNVTLKKGKEMVRFAVKTRLTKTERPLSLAIQGQAVIEEQEVAREAVAAEDKMQAFLWRHLVPAEELQLLVYDPSYQPPPSRVPAPVDKNVGEKPVDAAAPSKFTKRQVAGRLRQLKLLFEEWLITDDFYNRKVAECEAAL